MLQIGGIKDAKGSEFTHELERQIIPAASIASQS
jgi:hypothetical protein